MNTNRRAVVCVDATFGPPPLQNPLAFGADWVMHSATKYFGGHSDLLAGVVAGKNETAVKALITDRASLGTIMSGQTAWLLLRSMRTFNMRVERQAYSATYLVQKLEVLKKSGKLSALVKVSHSSLQPDEFVKTQMVGGHSPTFAIYLSTEQQAAVFPKHLRLFHHATSLGGVESLVEWRALSDPKCDRRLIRISTGVEDADDLYHDLVRGLSLVSNPATE